MKSPVIIAGALAVLALGATDGKCAVYGQGPLAVDTSHVTTVQWGSQYPRRFNGGPYRYGPRPYSYARPWVRRPYYGTIVAGVALGTLITVAAVGVVPRRPSPDLCWYWADPYRSRGYWDYCY